MEWLVCTDCDECNARAVAEWMHTYVFNHNSFNDVRSHCTCLRVAHFTIKSKRHSYECKYDARVVTLLELSQPSDAHLLNEHISDCILVHSSTLISRLHKITFSFLEIPGGTRQFHARIPNGDWDCQHATSG